MAQRETEQQSRRRPLVLYAEDDDEVYETYGAELRRHYDVERFRTGAETLNWLRDREGDELPNLIVLTYTLPDMTGVEVMAVLRMDQRFDHVFMVMLSNHLTPDVTEEAFRLGALQALMVSSMSPGQVARRLRVALLRRGRVG